MGACRYRDHSPRAASSARARAQAGKLCTKREPHVARLLRLPGLGEGRRGVERGPAGRVAAATAVADGLAQTAAHADGRVVLTPRGRLLADAVVGDLTG